MMRSPWVPDRPVGHVRVVVARRLNDFPALSRHPGVSGVAAGIGYPARLRR